MLQNKDVESSQFMAPNMMQTTTEKTRQETEEILDARGLVCPLPVLKARKRLQSLSSGSVLRVLSDDAGSLLDFRHFCTEQRHALLGQNKDERCAATIVHRIRKG